MKTEQTVLVHIVADYHNVLIIVNDGKTRTIGPIPYDGVSTGNPYLRFGQILSDHVGLDGWDCSLTVSRVTSGDLDKWFVRDKPVWFVRRACDDRMLCNDGLWRSSVSVDCIKFYSSAGRAEKYGLKGCKLVDSVADGSLQTRGTVYPVYPGQVIDRDGNVKG